MKRSLWWQYLLVLATDCNSDVRSRLPAGIGRKTEEEHKANTWGQQVHGVSFKKRAPRAIKEIRGFAEKAMVRETSAPICRMPLVCMRLDQFPI
jgi:hypothetical protein